MVNLTANPAQFESDRSFSFQMFDPNALTVRRPAVTLADIKAQLDAFVEELPKDKSFIVFCSWARAAGKPPRGYKAASDRSEFTRKLNRNAA